MLLAGLVVVGALHLLGSARDTLLARPDADRDELARVWLRLAEAQLQTSGFDAAARSSDAGHNSTSGVLCRCRGWPRIGAA